MNRPGAMAVIALLAIIAGLLGIDVARKGTSAIPLTSQYVAVVLTNGQAYFGHIERSDADYAVLTDVYYVQSRVDPTTKETSNALVKRGQEWHAPDRMVINTKQIVFVEPVTEQSAVSKLIDQSHHAK